VSSGPWRAYETIGDPTDESRYVFCCEHATNLLPTGIAASANDAPLLEDHWGWDIGARDVTHALVAEGGGQAVLSRFSRLVIDPNRGPDDETAIVRAIDGQTISFNAAVDDAEHRRRVDTLHRPYHDAVNEMIAARLALGSPVRLLAIHTFTPSYLGRKRPMEIGVLFDDYDPQAWELENLLESQGFETALNAPYSGKPPDGLIYSAKRHGEAHGIEYLELEIRQDLVDTRERASAVAKRIAAALSSRA
jgi:predicted N-formylglutamate amidohydrolase